MLSTAIAFVIAHQTAIVGACVAILPSLITAATNYAPAKGFVGVLKAALDVLSLLQHKDSPGTLNAPFVRSTPPVQQ